MRPGWHLAALCALLIACGDKPTPPAPKPAPEPATKAKPTDKAAKAAKKKPKRRRIRNKIPLPPPTQPPPRPEGEPQNPADFEKLSAAAEGGTPVKKPGAPPIQRLDAFKLRVGKVFVDRQKRVVKIPSKVNMTEGILEYYACATHGKLHESVLEVLVQPSHVHLALVLIGLDTTVWDRSDPKKMPTVKKPGGGLRMYVEWTDPETKSAKRAPAEGWLYNRAKKGAPKQKIWTFQGSEFWNGRYSADVDGSLVTLIGDNLATVATTQDAGNPYQGDVGYEVFTKRIPAKGTKVELVLEAVTTTNP